MVLTFQSATGHLSHELLYKFINNKAQKIFLRFIFSEKKHTYVCMHTHERGRGRERVGKREKQTLC